jgi:hypothetical protein
MSYFMSYPMSFVSPTTAVSTFLRDSGDMQKSTSRAMPKLMTYSWEHVEEVDIGGQSLIMTWCTNVLQPIGSSIVDANNIDAALIS